ncbi:hypothetical protein HanHA300_Chr01g0022931 [Helianthus annuus]|nr:hypothetical protein HanHA300_Chr01g0022931 [Helianthus annuus]
MKRTKEEWNRVEPYHGPLAFLAVLYVHEQRLAHNPVEAQTPAIKHIKTECLFQIDEYLYHNGLFSSEEKENEENEEEVANEQTRINEETSLHEGDEQNEEMEHEKNEEKQEKEP